MTIHHVKNYIAELASSLYALAKESHDESIYDTRPFYTDIRLARD
jgi:hypothetical protein